MYYEIYNPENIYVNENCKLMTPAEFAKKYDAVNQCTLCVLLQGRTVLDVKEIYYLKEKYKIDFDVTEEDSIQIINREYAKESTESSPLDRIASALEYIEIYLIDKGTL